jgi:PAS domain S-box-containing protein
MSVKPVVRSGLLLGAAFLLVVAVVQQAIELDRSGRQEVIGQFHTLQNLLVRQEVHEAVSYLQGCATDLRALAASPSLQDRDPASLFTEVEMYYQSSDHRPPAALEIVDLQGRVVWSSAASAGASEYAESSLLHWATQSTNQGQIFFGSRPRRAGDSPAAIPDRQFLLATPLVPMVSDILSNDPPASSGLLVMTINLESALVEHLAVLSPKSAVHRVWVMDHEGTILLQSEHPEMTRENIFRVQPVCLQCHVSFDYAKELLARQEGVTEYQLKGQPQKLAAFAPLRFANASWKVVVNTPCAAVTSFARRSFVQVLLLLGMLALALTLVSGVIYGSRASRIRAEQQAQRWQEKHHFEEVIRRAEARYRTLFEQSPDGVVMIDPQTMRLLEFSEAAHRQLGYSRAEFAGLRLRDYEASDTYATTEAHLARLANEEEVRFETRHRTREDEIRNVEVIGRTLGLAGRTVYHCIYHDITQRKRAEELLHRRTAQLEELHRANLAIAAEMEPKVLLETIIQEALILFRGTAGALFLQRVPEQTLELAATAGRDSVFADACRDKMIALAAKVWEAGGPQQVTGELRTGQDGTTSHRPCWATGVMVPILSSDTRVGVLGLFSELPGPFSREDEALLGLFSTQAAIAIKNAGLLEQVRRDAAVKTTLLHEVNHRVKNNLMRLAEIVRLGYEHTPPAELSLRTALQDLGRRLEGMTVVHTMLSTARWSPLPLTDLVTQVIQAALHGASTHHLICVSVDVPGEPLIVPEQATALALILNELATNSLKHALNNRAEARVEVRVRVEDRAEGRPLVRLEYRDDGPGWPETVLRGRVDTLGLSLIQATTRSPLRGGLKLSNRAGAVAELSFQLALPA